MSGVGKNQGKIEHGTIIRFYGKSARDFDETH